MMREYQAIVQGVLISGGTVDAPIGRHPYERIKMAINGAGKPAITHYRIIERYRAHTHLNIQLETGRTHQIRVHMLSLHHPIVGDQTYQIIKHPLPNNVSTPLKTVLKQLKRQALHAYALTILHPLSHEMMRFTSSLPEDILLLINELRKDSHEHR